MCLRSSSSQSPAREQCGRRVCAEALEPRRLLAAAELAVDVDPRVVGGTPISSNLDFITEVGDRAFFLAGGSSSSDSSTQLWTTDGTAGGTTLLKGGLVTGLFSFSHPRNVWTATVGSSFYFVAKLGSFGEYRLWRSDGTAAGTAEVAGSPTTPR